MESGARQPKGVVGATHLSHGTLMCRNLVNSRRFYEEFLGLQDLDGNWWESQYEKKGIDDFFNPGDVIDMSADATVTAASHD